MTVMPSGAAATAVRTTSARSVGVSVWYSPREPLGTTPSQPFSPSQRDVVGVAVEVGDEGAAGAGGAQRQGSGDEHAVPGAGR